MGKKTNVKLWATILVGVMIASTFVGLSAMVVGDATAKTADLEVLTHDDVALAYEDLLGQQLNMNALEEKRGMETQPTPLSPPPQPEEQGTWTYDFDSDTVGNPPAAPPWNFIDTAALGQPSWFGPDDFEDDVLGGVPDMPPWTTVDGSAIVNYWGVNYEDLPGDSSAIAESYHAGSEGYFYTVGAPATLTNEPAPGGGVPGTIYAGFTAGSVSALFDDGGSGAQSYFGPVGINDGMTTNAYCGGWVNVQTDDQFDLILTDYNGGGDAAVLVFFGGGLYYFDGAAFPAIPGPSYGTNAWHECFIEYDDTAREWTLWWDGTDYGPYPYLDATANNVDGIIWYSFGNGNRYIDNFYHFEPPLGFTNNVEVVDTFSVSGSQSIYIDQDGVAAANSLASISAEFNPMMAGSGYWSFWFRTDDTAANTNGAIAELLNQYGNGAISVRANGGDFQCNDGGAWQSMETFAASTWYEFNITFDTVTKTFTVDIGANSYGPYSFASESGTLAGVIYSGTGGTQSEHYIDDVRVECLGQGPEIVVSDVVSHSAPNALRIQEYNAAGPCYIAADQLGAGLGAVGTLSYWFYNTDNGGGNVMYLLDSGAQMVTIISMGVNLVDYSGMDGTLQFVNNDGAGLWVVDGPSYAPGTWHEITIDYDCSNIGPSGTGQFTYSYDGGAAQGPYGMVDPVGDLSIVEIDGNAPDSFGDFFYDDFYLMVNEMPGAPTNCWAELPGGGVETWENDTVDQDNPVEGTVVGTFNDIDEVPPGPPDGVTQDITEDFISGGTTPVTLINGESFEGAWPPTGWTETAGSRWNGEAGPGGLPDGSLCADFDGGAPSQAGDLDTPVLDMSDAGSFTVDFWYYSTTASEATDLIVYYYDGGTWDPIQNLGGGGAWTHYQDIDNTDAQYQHAAFQVRFSASTTANQEDEYIDLVTISKNVVVPDYCSLEHRWRTETVSGGAMTLDLFVRARRDAGADDTFGIGIATAVGGPYTPVGITISNTILTTQSASILGNSGVLYINVIDDNDVDPAQQDTVYIDSIWIEYYSMGGSVTTTQVAIADNPVDGTVTGDYTDTIPPADGTSENIAEVAASSTGGPSPLQPGPGPEPQVVLVGPEDFGALPAGWSSYVHPDASSANDWIGPVSCSASGLPNSINGDDLIWGINWDTPLVHASFETDTYDFSGYQNIDVQFDHFMTGAWGETLYFEYSLDGGGIGGTWVTAQSWTADGSWTDWTQRGPFFVPGCDFEPSVTFRFRYYGADGNLNGLDWFVVNGDVAGNTLEHIWTMENMPADSTSRTLHVVARHNTGSDDAFVFGWSQNIGGPYTPIITVNSDAFTEYTGPIGVAFVGPVYIQVIDDNGGDATTDTVYVDAIWVESEVSAVSTDIVVHWDLSVDDGGGEDDIVSYDIYRADEEEGDDITGPYTYIGSSPAGMTTYNDIGEGADLANQAWYYVEANDGSQANGSGIFSKLNFPPVAENLLTNGMTGLVISPFTPSIALTADANDTSNNFEAIPQMFAAEFFVNVDPGEGLGTPMAPVDAVWDTYIEPLQGTVDSSTWTPGTYTIGVRVAEDDGGATLWGPVSYITVDVVDGPPIANAGPDQQVAQHTLVTFDGSLSTDDVGITNYWWNFTDGTPQTLTTVSPTYTFDNEGIYTVTLTVMDTVGQTNSDTMDVNVTDGDPPVADAGADQQVTPGDIVNFDGTASYDPGHLGEPVIDGIVNWTWTFEDGTGPQTEYGATPNHQFNVPGVYTVTLTVTDAAPAVTGGPYTDTDTMDVTVTEIFDIDVTPAMGSDDWILVSYPNQVSGDPLVIVQDALDAGAGLVTWDIIQTYNATTGEWLTTSTFKPASMNTFTYVDNNMAFWLHITSYGDGLLTITGALATPGEQAVIPLKAGWNLVGYPFGTSQEMFNTFGTLFSLDRDVEGYDAADPYRLRIYDVWTEWHDPGAGYWVHVAFDEDMFIWAP